MPAISAPVMKDVSCKSGRCQQSDGAMKANAESWSIKKFLTACAVSCHHIIFDGF